MNEISSCRSLWFLLGLFLLVSNNHREGIIITNTYTLPVVVAAAVVVVVVVAGVVVVVVVVVDGDSDNHRTDNIKIRINNNNRPIFLLQSQYRSLRR